MFARADTLKVVSNAVREPVMLPGEWGEVYRWVIADKKEVLMLIRYHYEVLTDWRNYCAI